jgi:transposase
MVDSEKPASAVQPEMKTKRKTYEGLFKARVVSEWINGKRNLSELAEEYRIHPNQIKNWKSLLLKNAAHILADKRRSKDHWSGQIEGDPGAQ